MKYIKSIFKVLAWFIAIVLFYLLVAFVLSRIPVSAEENTVDEMDIYILTNGIHTDIVVPTITDQRNWFESVTHLNPKFNKVDFKYLAIGWGDKGFYLNTPTWAELKASTALKAVVGLSGTAVHATYYRDMTESETCKRISISKDQYARLINFIDESFENSTNGNVMQIDTDVAHNDRDGFYEATGRYSVLYTCNTWANQALKAGGQRACLWTAFQEGIFLKY